MTDILFQYLPDADQAVPLPAYETAGAAGPIFAPILRRRTAQAGWRWRPWRGF